ncbi:hypothetical protein [Haloprofundus salilacus]|uniref:hypothetical protein n=1 Tax=Haloprofundus salilacus TaxID=2876190 RepID=UPI001CCD16A4|nr:hypothetical protein [Haloprofundus salilacus]
MDDLVEPVVVEEFENARVVEVGETSYYLPNEISKSVVAGAPKNLQDSYENLEHFTRTKDSMRDPTRRAIYWAKLQERADDTENRFPLKYDQAIRNIEIAERISIPWLVAKMGSQAVLSAYLAAHGKPNSFLAEALEVSESTISQYLSDFKADRR